MELKSRGRISFINSCVFVEDHSLMIIITHFKYATSL